MSYSPIAIDNERNRIVLALVLVGLLHVAVNLQFSGPTYTADEIGYLFNAIVLAGGTIDGASSYHLGYSLLLSPIFSLQLSDEVVWNAIVLLNSLLFIAALYVTYVISKSILPSASHRCVAVLLCGMYPAAVSFSGYAFAQAPVTLLFALACYFLLKAQSTRLHNLIMHGACVGLVYWIHPTALAIAVASVASLAALSWRDRSYLVPAIMSVTITCALIVTYKEAVHPTLVMAMTPQGFQANLHYPKIAGVFGQIANLDAIRSIIVRVVGQFSYLILGTLGFFFVGGLVLFQHAQKLFRPSPISSPIPSLSAFVLLSLVGISFMSSIMFEAVGANWASHYFYGRYIEAIISLPIIAGLLSPWPRGRWFRTSIVTSIVLFAALVHYEPHNHRYNWVNVSAFWPAIILGSNLTLALLLGAVATLVFGFLYRAQKLIILSGVFICTFSFALVFHKNEWRGRSEPNQLAKLLAEAFPSATCVAFDPNAGHAGLLPGVADRHRQGLLRQRLKLYGYYLRRYAFTRMTISQWRSHCDGPYLTFDAAKAQNAGHLIAKEEVSGLLVVGKQPFQSNTTYRGLIVVKAGALAYDSVDEVVPVV